MGNEYLRSAAAADVDLLFQWANEPEVRSHSFSTAAITYEEHCQWFQRLLQDASRRQYIYMAGDIPVGQIRVQMQGERAEIGYSIDKAWRGRGYGKKMLLLLEQKLLSEQPEIRILTAKVKAGNVPSEHVFLKAGYRPQYTMYEWRREKHDSIWTPDHR